LLGACWLLGVVLPDAMLRNGEPQLFGWLLAAPVLVADG
jgi:hypothetical protein